MSRPSEYSQEKADLICERIADGESLRAICLDEEMPNKSTVFRWLVAFPDFATKYAHAREAQADTLVDELIGIADDGRNDSYTDAEGNVRVDHDVVARSKLRVATRQWVAEKLRPKKYGQKLEIDQKTTLTDLTDEQLNARIAQLSAAAGG